jgi:pyruvate/2-oxoglutarate dehydrogenase complex dihydrolipoamide acyltransferase (E2) component
MTEIKMPEAGFSVTEGTVIEWYRHKGDKVQEGENVVSVETDKITVDVPAEVSGVLSEIRYNPGEIAPVGDVLGTISGEGEKLSGSSQAVGRKAAESVPVKAVRRNTPVQTVEALNKPGAKPAGERKISPAAKAVARINGVDISLVANGSGPHGRIVKKDVLEFIESEKSQSPGVSEVKKTVRPPRIIDGGQDRRVDFTGWRKVIADRMLSSSNEIPHYSMSVEADVTRLSELITSFRSKKQTGESGPRMTYLPFMMKAIMVGIDLVPEVNSYCDGKGFTVKSDLNIGIAVDLGEKLLVPVVKDIRSKSIIELAEELSVLVDRARNDNLDREDVTGGTITLTNVGPFQIHSATSVILQPQTTIIYMGVAKDAPGVRDGHIEIRKQMIYGGTFDHRVINGAAGGRVLMEIKKCLEDLDMFLTNLR